MKDRASYGTPYTVAEARAVVGDRGHRIDEYHRELMAFLVGCVDELSAVVESATATLEAKTDRAHRMHVAKIFRARAAAVIAGEDPIAAAARADSGADPATSR